MLRPNAPKMTTVLLALGLFAVGLVGVLPQFDSLVGPVNDLLVTIPVFVELGLTFDRQLAHWLLVAGPTLLIVGSLLPGI